jgi:hypothetical protein
MAILRCRAFPTRTTKAAVLSHLAVLLVACQSVPTLPVARSSCPFDQVWDTAIASLEGAKLESADKAHGRLETAWLEVPSKSRAGLLERDVNKERVKYRVEITPTGSGAEAIVQQLREEWTPMGVRMRQWRAIPADSSEEMALANEISRRLKEKGC